ncbi:MAG: aminotransferase class I/II-fold pyridoxal phosphate-dependent enzyme [Candidatus Thermoplasmatota archaeon]|nr:aminotransferase class I/II-fold pyridoxal phosphate-dependent enzyme [Candidatus Thermoplasmatota archaeon]
MTHPSPRHALDDPRLSERVNLFPESVIREMTRIAARHDAVNLGQGFPDFDPPREMVDAAHRALDGPYNQYATTWGTANLRQAVADKLARFNGLDDVDPDANVTVTCGATEAMMCAMLSLVDPGDEVVLFDPYYENYGPDAVMSGAKLRTVPLRPDQAFTFDEDALTAAFSDATKAIIVNTPNNPTGKVFTRDEQRVIADLCIDHDVVAVTDEIYEHILYDGREHVSLATLDGMRERTLTISGASKTYSCTGWRVAWATAPAEMSIAMRRTHDFLTVGAPHPLQEAVAVALGFEDAYYDDLLDRYTQARTRLVAMLEGAGFQPVVPEGAYYIMADFSQVDAPAEAKEGSRAFATWLTREVGLTGVPGGSFYHEEGMGEDLIRFHFAATEATLKAAEAKLATLA